MKTQPLIFLLLIILLESGKHKDYSYGGNEKVEGLDR